MDLESLGGAESVTSPSHAANAECAIGSSLVSSNTIKSVSPQLKTISANDVAVVIQGPLTVTTGEVARSVRQVAPGAQIILSTWKGADTTGIDADIVLENDDPGSLMIGGVPRPDNVNRQIVSTFAGLKLVTRPYAVKLRSDCKLIHSGFFGLVDRYPRRATMDRVYHDRIICCRQFCRDPRVIQYLFHPSDVFQFGRTDDLRTAWDVPLRKLPVQRRQTLFRPLLLDVPIVSEQYLWLQVLEKAGHRFVFNNADDWSPMMVSRSEALFVNNYVPYSAEELGIELPPHFFKPICRSEATYSHELWRKLQERQCEASSQAIDIMLVATSGWFMFRYSLLRRWQLTRAIIGKVRRRIQHAVGLGYANP